MVDRNELSVLSLAARASTRAHRADKSTRGRWSEKYLNMKTIATPVAELLAQLHDHAAGVAKLIEAIPALKGDDLPQIVNRVHMLGKLAELEKPFDGRPPADKWLRTRVRLLQAHRQAQDDDFLSYEFQHLSNKRLATRVELLRKIAADRLNGWTNDELDEAIAELQRERRRRKSNAMAARAKTAKPSAKEQDKEIEALDEEDDIETDFEDVTSP